LEFELKSGKTYQFTSFTHRDTVIANIVQQASKWGHKIKSGSTLNLESSTVPAQPEPSPSRLRRKRTTSLPEEFRAINELELSEITEDSVKDKEKGKD